LKRAGYKIDITLLPWEKCLNEVAYGQEYALLMNATYSDERAQNYLFSKPYYTLNGALLYLTSRFPEKPKITTINDMKQYKYCGLQGYNYIMYDLPSSKLDNSAINEKHVLAKLRAGDCDFILADQNITKVFAALGHINLIGTDSIPVPEAKPKDFYILISKTNKNGPALQKSINDGLDAIRADGTYDKIMMKYGIN
jgi:polar amino acid transport system substrate-binding protein